MVKWFWFVIILFFFGAFNAEAKVVETSYPYTYEMLTDDVTVLEQIYKRQIQVRTIGSSHFGRNIYAVKLGSGKKNVLLVGAHHGREWLTSMLLMKMLETYSDAHQNQMPVGKFSTDILNEVSLWFIPMLNPDGVAIQQNQIGLFPAEHQKRLLFMNEGWDHYIRWKANGMGIDLNRQYPAGWKKLPNEPDSPSYQFYKGKAPLEAEEVIVLTNFVKEIRPVAAIAYHTAGREIFWKYKNGKHLKRDRMIAKKMAKLTKYKLTKPPKEAFGGGFTDWFITTYHRPAMTIEVSYLVGDRDPPLSVFKKEWKRNRYVGLAIASEAKKIKD